MNISDLKYPIGPFSFPETGESATLRSVWIQSLASLPDRLRAVTGDLTPEQWQTPYRPGGWTLRQLVHHIPDSHLNAYLRFKLALTEDEPAIKPYDEAAWADLGDTANTPPELSLALLDALHQRWVILLRSLPESSFLRTVFHPQMGRTLTLDDLLALYAWHSEHHLAHITSFLERER